MDEGKLRMLESAGLREEARRLRDGQCATCGGPAPKPEALRDDRSRAEFAISGMCQECQDTYFSGARPAGSAAGLLGFYRVNVFFPEERMMPGQVPCSPGERRAREALVQDAAEAQERIPLDELESPFPCEPCDGPVCTLESCFPGATEPGCHRVNESADDEEAT